MTVHASDGTTTDTTPTPAPQQPAPEPAASTPPPAPEPEPAATEPAATEPAPEPEPEVVAEVVADTLPAVRPDEVVHDAEVVDPADEKWEHPADWPYDWLDFKGDMLAYRVPNGAALTALYQAGETCSQEFQNKLINRLVKNHLSQASIERVLERMSDPADTEFASMDVWNELLRKIIEIGGERAKKEAEALAEVKNGGK